MENISEEKKELVNSARLRAALRKLEQCLEELKEVFITNCTSCSDMTNDEPGKVAATIRSVEKALRVYKNKPGNQI